LAVGPYDWFEAGFNANKPTKNTRCGKAAQTILIFF
jgi:hypothetical protein